jgi:hypothetical protein
LEPFPDGFGAGALKNVIESLRAAISQADDALFIQTARDHRSISGQNAHCRLQTLLISM